MGNDGTAPNTKRTGPLVLLAMVVAVAITAGAFFALKNAAVKPPPVFPVAKPGAPTLPRAPAPQ